MKPILFNGEMVRAILEGRKTQTRRIIKPQPDEDGLAREIATGRFFDTGHTEYRPPYHEGDVLYVRETWCHFFYDEDAKKWRYWYRADYPGFPDDRPDEWITGGDSPDKWHPSIHMPKDAARIWLKVTKVRCQQLWDISGADADAEGFGVSINNISKDHSRNAFRLTWRNCYGELSWISDPWVWVFEFERMERP